MLYNVNYFEMFEALKVSEIIRLKDRQNKSVLLLNINIEWYTYEWYTYSSNFVISLTSKLFEYFECLTVSTIELTVLTFAHLLILIISRLD